MTTNDVNVEERPGPTVIRVVAEDAPDVITYGPWLAHISLRGDCACGDGTIWRTEVDGRHIAAWLNAHADCKKVN